MKIHISINHIALIFLITLFNFSNLIQPVQNNLAVSSNNNESKNKNSILKKDGQKITNPHLLVSTIDGNLHLLEIDKDNNKLNKLWQHDFGKILETSLNDIKLYDEDTQMGILASLDGRLYKYNSKIRPDSSSTSDLPSQIDFLEECPFDLDNVLRNSFKLNNDIGFIGSVNILTLGIDYRTGKLLYNCSSNGCIYSENETNKLSRKNSNENDENLLVIKQTKYMVRAVSINNGNEKWNISLTKNDIVKYPKSSNIIESNASKSMFIGYDEAESNNNNNNNNNLDDLHDKLSFDVENGILKYNDITMKTHLNKPIIKCEALVGNNLESINIFSNQLKDNNFDPMVAVNSVCKYDKENKIELLSSISPLDNHHVGKYENLIYIQNKDSRFRSKSIYDIIANNNNNNNNKYKSENAIDMSFFYENALIDEEASQLPVLTLDKSEQNKLVPSAEANNFSNLFKFIYNNSFAKIQLFGYHNKKKSIYLFDQDFQEIIAFVLLMFRVVFITIAMGFIAIFSIRRKEDKAYERSKLDASLSSPKLQSQSNLNQNIDCEILGNNSFKDATNSNELSSFKSDSTLKNFDINNIDGENENSKNRKQITYNSRFLEDFEDISLIGKGGFGYVFEGMHKLVGRKFAIKRIKIRNRPSDTQRVLKEVKTLARLDSPYIVRYYHSWFEYPPAEWQKQVDKELLSKNKIKPESEFDELVSFTGSEGSNSNQTSNSYSNNQTRETESSSSGFRDDVDSSSDSLRLRRPTTATNCNYDLTSSSSSSSSGFIVFSDNTNNNQLDTNNNHEEDESSLASNGSSCGLKSLEKVKRQSSSGSNSANSSNSGSSSQELAKMLNNQNSQEEYIYLYIEMELCRAETLRHWLNSTQSKTRSHKQIFNLFEQILNAINYIHSQDLIHRDLKPSNILLSLDGTSVKIGDFGLVVSAEEDPDFTNSSNSLLEVKNNSRFNVSKDNNGTILYMSPEQVKHKEYSSKVDIYSLGVILYELIVSFGTLSERINTLKNLRENKFDAKFSNEYPIEKNLIAYLIEPNPDKRPSAGQVLKSAQFNEFKLAYD